MLTLICTEFDAQSFEGMFACGFASPKTLELLKIHVWDTGDLNERICILTHAVYKKILPNLYAYLL